MTVAEKLALFEASLRAYAEAPVIDELAPRRLAKMDAEFEKRVVNPINWPGV